MFYDSLHRGSLSQIILDYVTVNMQGRCFVLFCKVCQHVCPVVLPLFTLAWLRRLFS